MDNPFHPDYLFRLGGLSEKENAARLSKDIRQQQAIMDSIAASGSAQQGTAEYHDAHIAALEAQLEELRRQADAQEQLNRQLAEEAAARTRDDKKYFWLGILVNALVSVVVALAITYTTNLLWP